MSDKVILPFDMTLRFWSDDVPFDDIGARLNTSVHILYTKGHPMTGKAPIAGRIANRHYASLAHEKATEFSKVIDWLRATVRKVEADDALVHLMKTRQVESLFWIAMFGREPVPTPALDPGIVSSLVLVHSQAMIENYTAGGPDCPTKTWFPDRTI